MAGERHRLHRHALLHAAVARQNDDVVIEDGVLLGVEAGLGHLGGNRHSDAVGDALAKGPRRGLDPARRMRELGVSGGLGVELPEALDLRERDLAVAAEAQPRVKEHRTVARRRDEAVAIEPFRVGGIVREGVPEEHGPDFRTAQGKAQVTALAGVNGVEGEAPSDRGRLGEDFFRQHAAIS